MGSGASNPEKDEIAKGITSKERPVDVVDSVDGRTMLHSAVIAGDVEAVRFLVENGAGNVRDRDGKVPLWYALQHRDADVRGRLEAELGAHAREILGEVEDAVQVYLTDGVVTTTTGVAVERSGGDATTAPLTDTHTDGKEEDTNASNGDRQLGEDDLDGDTGALRHTDGRKVEWLQKTEDNSNKNSNGGEDLLCWLRGLPKVDPPLGYTDEHVRHMEAGLRVVCKRLLEDIRRRREAAGTRGHVEVDDWMAARDPFELLLSGFLFTSDCVEYVLDSGGDVVCDEHGTPQIAKGEDGKPRYIKLTERAVLDNHGSAAESQSLALYMTMNTAMRAVGWLPLVKEWKGTAAPNVFELSPAPPQLHVIATFAPLIRGLDRLIGSRRKQLRTVFRGINVNVSAKYALGTHIVWNCFTSTTLKRDVAQSFMYGKGGTFFVVVAKEGAADVKFSSVYASEDELLYTANIEYRVQWKLSPTLLRMMGLRFDVIVMQEVCTGLETTAAEQVGALQEVMGHTVEFFKYYLTQYVEGRVGDDTRVDESETRLLMKEVRRWLRARGRVNQTYAVCAQGAADINTKTETGKEGKQKKKKKTKCADRSSRPNTPEGGGQEGRKRKKAKCGVLCVIGEGGSGKTSASIAILSDLATSAKKKDCDSTQDGDAKPYFPVFVALPTVKQHLLEKGGLDRFVLESFALREADRAYLAETYEVVLVLDSLDEVGLTQEDVRAVVAEGGLLCRHPWVEAHCSVVVTVRGEYLKSVDASPSGVCGAGVRAVYMQPFTEVDARTYIKRANKAWKKERKKDVTKGERTVFVREEDVEGLVLLRNPFMLHMACHAQCSGKASEEVIYEAYLQTWTKKEMASACGSGAEDLSLEEVVRAGELVACRMLDVNEWQGTVGVASQSLVSQHDLSEAVRDACFRCLPFRIEDFGEERSAFTFRHKSLGEYLAARRLARDPAGTLGQLVQRSFSKDSQRVLGFFAALLCADSVLYERACTELLALAKVARIYYYGSLDLEGDMSSCFPASNAAALLARARIPVSGEDLRGLRLSYCDLRGSLFVETRLDEASFSNCWLEHTEFHACDMRDMSFPSCTMGTPLPSMRHPSQVHAMAVTPDGTKVVTGCEDTHVRVWGMETGKEVMTFVGHTSAVCAVAVTPDGFWIVSSSASDVRVWDMCTERQIHFFDSFGMGDVVVSPDSCQFFSCSSDKAVCVWDISTCELLSEPWTNTVDGKACALTVSADGDQVLSCVDNDIRIWDLATEAEVAVLKGHKDTVHGVVAPDGCHIVSCSEDATACLWTLSESHALVERLVFEATSALRSVAVTPDGGHVVAGSQDSAVYVWNMSTGTATLTLEGHRGAVNSVSVAVTPDGHRIVSCSEDTTLRVWDMFTGKEALCTEVHTSAVQSVALTPDGSVVSCGGETVCMWSPATGKQTQVFEGHTDIVRQVAVFADGSHLVSCSADKTVRVWSIQTGNEVHLLEGHTDSVTWVAVTPDASHVVSHSKADGVCVWHLPTGNRVAVWTGCHMCLAERIAVSPDGMHLVLCLGSQVLLCNLHTGKQVCACAEHFEYRFEGATVTPNGSHVVVWGGESDSLRVWGFATRKVLGDLIWTSQTSPSLSAVAATQDGEYLVGCNPDGLLAMWSMATRTRVAETTTRICSVSSVAVSPDGRTVVCGCSDKTVRVWEVCKSSFRLKRVIGATPTVPRALGCSHVDSVSVSAKLILLDRT